MCQYMENEIKDLDFYTIKQAAQRVGLGERYLNDAVMKDRTLKAFRQGDTIYIMHSDLIEYIKNGGDAFETKRKSNLPSTPFTNPRKSKKNNVNTEG
jgi:hypothetical protein